MLNTIAGLSKRIIELFDALDKFASEEYRGKYERRYGTSFPLTTYALHDR